MIAGLTGGIGSGKSTVARLFEILGWAVFNSDEVAKSIYYHEPVRTEIRRLLGEESYLPDQTLNKTYISERIFSDQALLARLNAIIHPAVGEQFRKFLSANKGRNIIKETALLFEAGLQGDVDTTIVVLCDEKKRIERVRKRSGLSDDAIRKIMTKQWTDEQRKAQAAHFLINDDSQLLIPQVINLQNKLTGQC